MSLNRRTFLTGSLGAGMIGAAALGPYATGGRAHAQGAGPEAVPATLRAALATARILPDDYPETPVWVYDGVNPGPVIRAPQGGRITRRLVNALDRPTATHWHGIRIANAMDGVPGLTQEAVPPGGTFDYDFVAPDAGTYWYHSHDRSFEQVARGLRGPLIVDEGTPPDVDADHILMLDDWRLGQDGRIAEDFGALMDAAHGGRIGNIVTTNGRIDWEAPVRRHDRLRLRLINAATARIFVLRLSGLAGWTVAFDGMPLQAPQAVAGDIVIAPAQRVDLIVDVTAAAGEGASVVHVERDGTFAQAWFPVSGGTRARRDPPSALPPNAVPVADLAAAQAVTLKMEGGAMGRMSGAMMGGEMTGMRDLAQAGKVWALNGSVDGMDAPLFRASIGETVRIGIVNDTAWAHGMHLHGHHFRRMTAAGPGPLRDTDLFQPGEAGEIALVADNPGDWMLHCHMLAHSEAGMMTRFTVG